jgi:hypothetical protein
MPHYGRVFVKIFANVRKKSEIPTIYNIKNLKIATFFLLFVFLRL